jgi:hypothetical protein
VYSIRWASPCQDSLPYHSTYWLTECQFVLCEPSQAMHNTVLSAPRLLSSEHVGTEIIRNPGPVFPSINLVRRAHHSRDVVQSSSLNNPRSTGQSPLFRCTKCVLSPCSPANKCLWLIDHGFNMSLSYTYLVSFYDDYMLPCILKSSIMHSLLNLCKKSHRKYSLRLLKKANNVFISSTLTCFSKSSWGPT